MDTIYLRNVGTPHHYKHTKHIEDLKRYHGQENLCISVKFNSADNASQIWYQMQWQCFISLISFIELNGL